jgi:hypothetical protein
MYKRLGGAQGRSGKFRPRPTGTRSPDPPARSESYSDYAVHDHTKHYTIIIIIIIIIIIMQCNNNFTGKYLAIIGPKLYEPPGDPDYRGTTVYKQGKALPALN